MKTKTHAGDVPKIHGPVSHADAVRLNAAGNDAGHAILGEMGIMPEKESDLISFTNRDGKLAGYASAHPNDLGTFLGKKRINDLGLPVEGERDDLAPVDQSGTVYDQLLDPTGAMTEQTVKAAEVRHVGYPVVSPNVAAERQASTDKAIRQQREDDGLPPFVMPS